MIGTVQDSFLNVFRDVVDIDEELEEKYPIRDLVVIVLNVLCVRKDRKCFWDSKDQNIVDQPQNFVAYN